MFAPPLHTGSTFMARRPCSRKQASRIKTLFLVISWFLWLGYGVDALAAVQIIIGPATKQDMKAASGILLKMKMNPLIASADAFLTAKMVVGDSSTLVGFGQIRQLGQNYAELASVYVVPKFRRKGVASKLISALIERHEATDQSSNLCLLTLYSTAPLYEKFGFQAVKDETEMKRLPAGLQFEFAAGKVISWFLGNTLICMTRKHSRIIDISTRQDDID